MINSKNDTQEELLEFIKSNAPKEKREKFIKYIEELQKDSLTGVFTRGVFKEILAKELARSFRTKEISSFCLCDVNGLKK